MGLSVVCLDENVLAGKPASIKISMDGKLVVEIHGTTEPQVGADGGSYPGVTLTCAVGRPPVVLMDGALKAKT